MPIIGALTSGVKNEKAPTTTTTAGHGRTIDRSHTGSGIATIASAAASELDRLREVLRENRAGERTDAEAAEEEAGNVRVAVEVEERERVAGRRADLERRS